MGGAIIPRSLWYQNPNTWVVLLGIIVAWDFTLEPWGGEDSREADRIRMNNIMVLSSRTQPVLAFNKSDVRAKFSKH